MAPRQPATACPLTVNNLTLIGTGTKTIPSTGATTVSGNLSVGGTTGVTTSAAMAVTGSATFAGGAVTLGGNLTVTGGLTLTSGIITTGANTVIANGAITGGSSTAFINGKLQRPYTNLSFGAKDFPVGTGTDYSPVTGLAFSSFTRQRHR